ncbi:hypothetical protein BJ978_003221 [Agromyces terreus]|uniref:Uncharacterized protein n=1 Tax=Agromyces terreus TaxID=424795 RepID=A0A9X2H4B2_9MICO|nr:hypothetical protein [Agromyces terreus]MCP2372545.1 hypothetical protein [Agromyces terreus]
MALADTFAISGGDHSRWSNVLYFASAAAFVGAVVLPIVFAFRNRRVTHGLRPVD